MGLEQTRDFKYVQTVRPASLTGAVTGQTVDTEGYGEAMVILDVGVITATGTLDVKMQEAPADAAGVPGTWADITGAVFSQKLSTTDDQAYIGRLQLGPGRGRFIRAVATQATAAVLAGVGILLMQGKAKPSQAHEWIK